MNIREMLEMALRVETLAEKIYLDLSEMFPEAKSLFDRLSCEESRHADIIAINMGFLGIDALPPEFAIDMIPLIKKTLAIATELEKKIEKKEATLSEALQLSLTMEETGVEAYFQEVMRGESSNDALNYVRQFYNDSEHHADVIKEFKNSLELKGTVEQLVMAENVPKLNCWEFMGCGRQPGGTQEHDLGRCPVTKETRLEGVHVGLTAGRACWVVAGTLCEGEIQGTFARKFKDCSACDFYRKVCREECSLFQSPAELLAKLKDAISDSM